MQDLLPPLLWLAELAWVLLTFTALGRVFKKLGQPAWIAWVPIYNLIVLTREARGKLLPHLLLYLIPCVNLIALGHMSVGLARRFDRGPLYGLGLAYLPFVFYPHLGFANTAREIEA